MSCKDEIVEKKRVVERKKAKRELIELILWEILISDLTLFFHP
jgi:hypothetical protein